MEETTLYNGHVSATLIYAGLSDRAAGRLPLFTGRTGRGQRGHGARTARTQRDGSNVSGHKDREREREREGEREIERERERERGRPKFCDP